MIAFVDVPPGTTFLPQAAELNDGQVVTFFSPLIEKLQRDGGIRPVAYPESTATDAGRQQRYAHWNWFTHHWNADKAVEVMEEVIGTGGRPRWIAYRMTFSSGTTLHLDVSARGDYDTGIFAYIPNRRSTMPGSWKARADHSARSRPGPAFPRPRCTATSQSRPSLPGKADSAAAIKP